MRTPTEGVFYDSTRRQHLIVVVLDATEAENIAAALPFNDRGGDDLREWAAEARRLDTPDLEDVDGDLAEQEQIAAAVEAGHGYQGGGQA